MKVLVIFALLMLSVLPAAAQDAPVCVPVDGSTLASVCNGLDAGQACLMQGAPVTSLRDESTFVDVDARIAVNQLESMTTQPGDVTRVRLPANLDDGDALDAILFGGVTLTNLVPVVGTLDAVTVDRARVRSTPDTNSDLNIVIVLEAGTPVTAVGRDEANDWVQVRYGDGQFGWAADFLLRVAGDAMTLPVGDASRAVFSPMQSFTLATTPDAPACADGIPGGALVYSDIPNTAFTVNGANITFEGVVFVMPVIQVGRPAVRIEQLSGKALVQTEQGVVFLVPGSMTTVVVSSDLTTPLDAPLDVQPSSAGLSEQLAPFATLFDGAAPPVLAEPAQGAMLEQQMVSLFAPDGLLPGNYRLTNLVVDAPTPLPGFDCLWGSEAADEDWADRVAPQMGSVNRFAPDIGDMFEALYGVEMMPGVQVNGAMLNDHNDPMYRTVPEADGENIARTVVVNSLTSFTLIESWALRRGSLAAACYSQLTWEWVAP
jgi:hypothetical protein